MQARALTFRLVRLDFGHHARRLPTADCRFIWDACARLPTLQAAEAELNSTGGINAGRP